MASNAEAATGPPAPREGEELPAPPEPAPAADDPEALTLEGLSVNPDPDEVASGRALDAAHTDHDDISTTRPGVTPGQPPLTSTAARER